MALQVWMPLNGNLNNQGISSLNAVQSTAPTYVNGKIGKAMSTGAFYLPAAQVAKFYNNNAMSFCFWIYPTTSDSTSVPIIGQSAMSAGDNRMFTIYQYNTGTSIHLSWQNENASGTFLSVVWSNVLTVNTWNHVAITYDGSTAILYVNGVVKGTQTGTSARSNFSYNVPIPNASSRYLNDIRIYNHCLSVKEIKEICKGLVAHYKLDDFGPNPNEIANSMPYSSTSGFSNAGTGWGAPTLVANTISPSGYVVRSTYTGSGGASGGIHHQPYDYSTLENGAIYTFSVWARASKNIPANIYNEMMSSKTPGMPVTLTTEWQHFIVSGPINTSATYHSDVIYATGTDVTTNMWIECYGLKLEKGNQATAWIPHTTDTQYSKYSTNTAYDGSGLKNNGTLSSNKPTVSNDSPRYNSCMQFNGTNNYINCGRGAMVKDSITVSMWCYASDWGNHSGNIKMISCTEGGGWNIYHKSSDNKIQFDIGTGTSSNTYKAVTSVSTVTGSGWHMFTTTYDGLNVKMYIDGVLNNTTVAYSTKTPIYYNSNNTLFIATEAGPDATTPTGEYFNGKISDVRIYATALSADDIKELYQTSASITNNGTLMTYEFIET